MWLERRGYEPQLGAEQEVLWIVQRLPPCHGRTTSYVILLIRTTIRTVSFPFYYLPFPHVLYHHVFDSVTRSLPCTSMTFYLGDSYSYHDSTHFYVLLSCSFPRTRILGIPASGGASKPSTCINRHPRRPRTSSWSSWQSSLFFLFLSSLFFSSSIFCSVQSGKRAPLLRPVPPIWLVINVERSQPGHAFPTNRS